MTGNWAAAPVEDKCIVANKNVISLPRVYLLRRYSPSSWRLAAPRKRRTLKRYFVEGATWLSVNWGRKKTQTSVRHNELVGKAKEKSQQKE